MIEVDDVLSPAFYALAAKAKVIADAKVKELDLFNELVQKHKAKVTEFDKALSALIAEYKSDKLSNPPEAVHAAK